MKLITDENVTNAANNFFRYTNNNKRYCKLKEAVLSLVCLV
jgi:hypothetical protein